MFFSKKTYILNKQKSSKNCLMIVNLIVHSMKFNYTFFKRIIKSLIKKLILNIFYKVYRKQIHFLEISYYFLYFIISFNL